ncbi:MAG: amidase family protein, partial [Candidatus Komeilibacteria bacterium]|nr:amidase family protein [Candidatus Komeilibacteria bacterium]
DELDATTVLDEVGDYSKEITKDLKGLTIGVPEEYFKVAGMDSEVRKITEEKIEHLSQLGCKIKKVSLPYTKYAIACYYIIVPSEDSSNLARLDGVRYGVRSGEKNLYDIYAKSRESGFPEEVKRRILIGTYALSAGYYDAYYKKAQAVRTLIKKDFEDIFKKVDALIAPTSPFPAFGLGEKADDLLAMYLADVLVSPAALAGLPALSVPGGKTKKGLPVGVQVIGPRMSEGLVMKVGHNLE